MTKLDLLKGATLHYTLGTRSRAYAFAARTWTDAEIDAVRQRAEHRAKFIARVHTYLCWAGFIGCAVGASVLEMENADSIARATLGLLSALACLIAFSAAHWVVEACAGYSRIADLLTPVAGTDMCQTGVNLLREGGPNVTAWRDAVLSERSQLYSFDLKVMQAMSWLHYVDATAERKRVEQENACRELHGVATEVSAN